MDDFSEDMGEVCEGGWVRWLSVDSKTGALGSWRWRLEAHESVEDACTLSISDV